MSLREMLSDYWYAFQQELFPRLESELGPMGERYELFVAVLELVRVEALLPYFRGRVGRPEEDRTALARAFTLNSLAGSANGQRTHPPWPVWSSVISRSDELGARRDETGLGKAPERDQELAGERHHHHLAHPSSRARCALLEPRTERALGLISQPAPRQLDELSPDPCRTVAADPLVALGIPTRPGSGRQAGPVSVLTLFGCAPITVFDGIWSPIPATADRVSRGRRRVKWLRRSFASLRPFG